MKTYKSPNGFSCVKADKLTAQKKVDQMNMRDEKNQNPVFDVIAENNEQDDKDAYDGFQADGKVQINELLHRYLPGGTTIRELENLAIVFHDTIRDRWEDSEYWAYVNNL